MTGSFHIQFMVAVVEYTFRHSIEKLAEFSQYIAFFLSGDA